MNAWLGYLAPVLILAVLAVVAAPGIVVALFILQWRKRRARDARRSPLTKDLLRSAGQSVQAKIDEQYENIWGWAGGLIFLPMTIFAAHLCESYLLGQPETAVRIGINLAFGIGSIIVLIFKLWKTGALLDRLKIGLDAEMAVGEELNQLMRDGAAVFHDLPAEQFNIDHVVICPAGVYAIETKGRSKPPKGGGSESVRVEFDGHALKFPNWTETKPIEQAQRQAEWLERWLTSAVGTPIPVIPVLILPGWFIERKARSVVRVFNGKKPQFLLRACLRS